MRYHMQIFISLRVIHVDELSVVFFQFCSLNPFAKEVRKVSNFGNSPHSTRRIPVALEIMESNYMVPAPVTTAQKCCVLLSDMSA